MNSLLGWLLLDSDGMIDCLKFVGLGKFDGIVNSWSEWLEL